MAQHMVTHSSHMRHSPSMYFSHSLTHSGRSRLHCRPAWYPDYGGGPGCTASSCGGPSVLGNGGVGGGYLPVPLGSGGGCGAGLGGADAPTGGSAGEWLSERGSCSVHLDRYSARGLTLQVWLIGGWGACANPGTCPLQEQSSELFLFDACERCVLRISKHGSEVPLLLQSTSVGWEIWLCSRSKQHL
jgi:hypothetical protein